MGKNDSLYVGWSADNRGPAKNTFDINLLFLLELSSFLCSLN